MSLNLLLSPSATATHEVPEPGIPYNPTKKCPSGDAERNGMFKLIPHIADGSWVIKQSVGTVPVLMGTKLRTTYHSAGQYLEVRRQRAAQRADG